VLESLRYTSTVEVVDRSAEPGDLPMILGEDCQTVVIPSSFANASLRDYCGARRISIYLVDPDELRTFPSPKPCPDNPISSRKKVLVTGCFDWLHSGHVRFFEEVSELGDLYVVVGHDANIRLLKGHGKPMFGQNERCYCVDSFRFVKQAMVSSGSGWLDAEPEIERLKPDVYVVNEDGDVPEKRDYCQARGIEYIVLKRLPKPGLPARTSTALRGH
jgi:cytidyltransferase-like protein